MFELIGPLEAVDSLTYVLTFFNYYGDLNIEDFLFYDLELLLLFKFKLLIPFLGELRSLLLLRIIKDFLWTVVELFLSVYGCEDVAYVVLIL